MSKGIHALEKITHQSRFLSDIKPESLKSVASVISTLESFRGSGFQLISRQNPISSRFCNNWITLLFALVSQRQKNLILLHSYNPGPLGVAPNRRESLMTEFIRCNVMAYSSLKIREVRKNNHAARVEWLKSR